MLELRYKVGLNVYGQPRVLLSHNGHHLGTVWGTVCLDMRSIFEQENNIIHIRQGDNRIVTLWNVLPAEETK